MDEPHATDTITTPSPHARLTPADRAVLIAIWRRCLTPPLNRGTLLAMGELIALTRPDEARLLR